MGATGARTAPVYAVRKTFIYNISSLRHAESTSRKLLVFCLSQHTPHRIFLTLKKKIVKTNFEKTAYISGVNFEARR